MASHYWWTIRGKKCEWTVRGKKYELLTKHWMPHKGYRFPVPKYQNRSKRFNTKRLKMYIYLWLVYWPSDDAYHLRYFVRKEVTTEASSTSFILLHLTTGHRQQQTWENTSQNLNFTLILPHLLPGFDHIWRKKCNPHRMVVSALGTCRAKI